jgi:hypothetical protein
MRRTICTITILTSYMGGKNSYKRSMLLRGLTQLNINKITHEFQFSTRAWVFVCICLTWRHIILVYQLGLNFMLICVVYLGQIEC